MGNEHHSFESKDGSAGASPSPSVNPSYPQRRRPAHGVKIYTSTPTLVFLTVCTKERAPWLANEACHELLRAVWSDARAWLVSRYVIMPDHLHVFAAPGQPELPLDNWVSYWKSLFSKRHGNHDHRWQSDHWDRRLRSDESYCEKWDYTCDNPVRHGLVRSADEWPYQGELFELRW